MEKKLKNKKRDHLISIILLMIGIAIGAFIVVQIRSAEKIARTTDPVKPNLRLSETVDEMELDQDALKERISDLRGDVKEKEETLKKRRSTSKELTKELDEYKSYVGLTKVKGEGVEVTLDDGEFSGTKDRNDFKNDAIIHSTDILDVVNLLWSAGAEAISINDERVVLSTSINCIVNTILVNESHVGTPVVIKAIGKTNDLEDSIKKRANLPDLYERKEKYDLRLDFETKKDLEIGEYRGSYES